MISCRAHPTSGSCLINPGPLSAPIPPKQQHHSQNFRTDRRVYKQAGSTEGQYNDPRAHRTTENMGETDFGSFKGEARRCCPHNQTHAVSRRLCKSTRCSI